MKNVWPPYYKWVNVRSDRWMCGEASCPHGSALTRRFVVRVAVGRCDEVLAQFRGSLMGWSPWPCGPPKGKEEKRTIKGYCSAATFWNALSREFRCRWRHLSCKLRPEIDNRFTFTLIKTTMRFKQIRTNIYRFWCQNGAILLLPFWLENQSQMFPEKNSPYWIICISWVCFTFHCTS